ncbi:probable acyl-CoA dehydrogenase YngJ, partial [Arthrobacter sp. Hiyo6]
SDAGGTKTTARREVVGGENVWVINGNKEFITNSGTDITRLVTVTAVTNSHERKDGSVKKEISTLLVPADTPGFKAEKAYNKVGWNASDTHPLTLKDVHVPEANLLGEEGRGYANFLSILDEGRIAIAALATGAAQGCVDLSVKYAKERSAFGQNIGKYQAIAFKIARMQHAPTPPGWPTTMPPPGCSPGSRSRRRRPSLRWSQARQPWTTRGTPPRCSAAMASSTSSPWHAITATPRSLRSGRAPRRFS